MKADDIVTIVGYVTTGGVGTAIGTWVSGRAAAHRIKQEADAAQAKLPGEIGNIAILGAEKTILLMQGANETLQIEMARKDREIVRMEALLSRKDEQIASTARAFEALREDYNSVREQVSELFIKLRDADTRYAALQAEFAAIRAERPPATA